MSTEIIWLGSIASLVAGFATGTGALPILFTRRISDRLLDVMLGFSAGVMLAATSFSLIVPAIDLSGPLVAVFGLVLGALALHLVDHFIPHYHPFLGARVRGLGFVINREAMKRFTATPSVEYSRTERTVGRIYPWLGIVFVFYSIFLPLKLALTTSRA